MSFVLTPIMAFAEEAEDIKYPDPPVWEEYVPHKYENPRTDFKRGNAIAELTAGVILTDLLITAPIGVPMICHSATKLKNISYSKKKVIFDQGLTKAQSIVSPEERGKYYDEMLKKIKFTEKRRQKYMYK